MVFSSLKHPSHRRNLTSTMTKTACLRSALASLLVVAVLLLIQIAVLVASEPATIPAHASARLVRRMVDQCVLECNKVTREQCLDKTPNPCTPDEVPGDYCIKKCAYAPTPVGSQCWTDFDACTQEPRTCEAIKNGCLFHASAPPS